MLDVMKNRVPTLTGHDNIINYCKLATELCWLMSIQDPPVYMCCNVKNGQPFDKQLFGEFTSRGEVFAFMVWPALLLEKDGQLLCRGVAQAANASKKRSYRKRSDTPDAAVSVAESLINKNKQMNGDKMSAMISVNSVKSTASSVGDGSVRSQKNGYSKGSQTPLQLSMMSSPGSVYTADSSNVRLESFTKAVYKPENSQSDKSTNKISTLTHGSTISRTGKISFSPDAKTDTTQTNKNSNQTNVGTSGAFISSTRSKSESVRSASSLIDRKQKQISSPSGSCRSSVDAGSGSEDILQQTAQQSDNENTKEETHTRL